MVQRNRATGWKHAKLSGHTNEEYVKELLDSNVKYGKNFMAKLGFTSETIKSTLIGGIHEKNVPGVLGKKTKSKTDFKIKCNSGKNINSSINQFLMMFRERFDYFGQLQMMLFL